ncbi:MAG: hypothetical protein IT529_02325 [Burkholderiales bacterium]|nr:hypothetical protein [Burkholderiales bacterium]
MLTPARRASLGKRAGVAAGLLGVLCVIAEFCFLLPDLFVTRDALPLYAANIGLFRGVLQSAILATFVLGAASVLLLRSKTYGLTGIALAAIALLLGGAEAEPLAIDTPRAMSAGLDYLVLELLVLGLIFIPLERLYSLREHHRDPEAMLEHDFVETNGATCLAAAPVLGVAAATPAAAGMQAALQILLACSALLAVAANQCHKWAHMRAADVPRFARLLQRLRIALPPDAHRNHHTRPFDTHYCTASGRLNRLLDRTGFFRGMERAFRAVRRRSRKRGAGRRIPN